MRNGTERMKEEAEKEEEREPQRRRWTKGKEAEKEVGEVRNRNGMGGMVVEKEVRKAIWGW